MAQELNTQDNKYSALCLSGGIDSTSLLLRLLTKNKIIYAISFNYGQKHKIELNKANENIKYLSSKGYNINHKIIPRNPKGFISAQTLHCKVR